MSFTLKPTRSGQWLTGAALLTSLGLTGCDKKEEVVTPSVANEAITTMTLTAVNTATPGDTQTATWEQLLDAQGNPVSTGPNVSQANLTFKPNATYTVTVGLLDKSQSPAFNVGDEIRQRANIHGFFFQPLPTTQPLTIPAPVAGESYPAPIPTPLTSTTPLNLTVTRSDLDTNSPARPVGLTNSFTTGAASTGYLRVVLRHQPNSKDGTFTPGSTDFDAGFNVKIQ